MITATSSSLNNVVLVNRDCTTGVNVVRWLGAAIHILLLVFAFSVTLCTLDQQHGITLFAWHPVLLTAGTVVLFTEGVLAFRSLDGRSRAEVPSSCRSHALSRHIQGFHAQATPCIPTPCLIPQPSAAPTNAKRKIYSN